MTRYDCLIGIGSNVGDSRQLVEEAFAQLSAWSDVESARLSSLMRTRPIGGPPGQADFVNAAARFSTSLNADSLHQRIVEIEQSLGRVREMRWGPRRIDLDLLLHGGTIVDSESLVVPHPRMTFRRFVIQPALEIAADMIHPVSQCTIGDYHDHIGNAPKEILFCGGAKEYRRALITSVSDEVPTGWRLLEASDVDNGLTAAAPLMVVRIDSATSPAEDRLAGRPVPQLMLSGVRDSDVIELRAALQALAEWET